MPQESAKDYFKRVFKQAKTDSDFLSVKKAIGSVGFGALRSLFHKDATTVMDFLIGIVLPALGAYAVLCVGELAWNIVRSPLVLDRQRADELASQEHERTETIQRLESELQKAVSATISGYSQAQIAKLAFLLRQANELYSWHISVNEVNPKTELDNWLRVHDDWRREVLSILRDRDAVIFEGPITAGAQTTGLQGALNSLHGNRRGQLLEEMARLTKVLERNQN